jgi:hypothetical protein
MRRHPAGFPLSIFVEERETRSGWFPFEVTDDFVAHLGVHSPSVTALRFAREERWASEHSASAGGTVEVF